jgi:hypothetical protein
MSAGNSQRRKANSLPSQSAQQQIGYLRRLPVSAGPCRRRALHVPCSNFMLSGIFKLDALSIVVSISLLRFPQSGGYAINYLHRHFTAIEEFCIYPDCYRVTR